AADRADVQDIGRARRPWRGRMEGDTVVYDLHSGVREAMDTHEDALHVGRDSDDPVEEAPKDEVIQPRGRPRPHGGANERLREAMERAHQTLNSEGLREQDGEEVLLVAVGMDDLHRPARQEPMG